MAALERENGSTSAIPESGSPADREDAPPQDTASLPVVPNSSPGVTTTGSEERDPPAAAAATPFCSAPASDNCDEQSKKSRLRLAQARLDLARAQLALLEAEASVENLGTDKYSGDGRHQSSEADRHPGASQTSAPAGAGQISYPGASETNAPVSGVQFRYPGASETHAPDIGDRFRYPGASETHAPDVGGRFRYPGASETHAPDVGDRFRYPGASETHAPDLGDRFRYPGASETHAPDVGDRFRYPGASETHAPDVGDQFRRHPGASETHAPDGGAQVRYRGESGTYAPDGGRPILYSGASGTYASDDGGQIRYHGASGTHAPADRVQRQDGADQTLRDLASALMEVARGDRPANKRCLRPRDWKHRCKSKPCEVNGCKYFHHRLLHADRNKAAPAVENRDVAACASDHTCGQRPTHQREPLRDDQTAAVTSAKAARAHQRTLLKVIPVRVTGPHGEIDAYALLDDGSTVTLVTEEIAQQVGAQGPHDPFFIEAVGGARIDAARSQRVNIEIKGKYSERSVSILARTIDQLDISAQSVSLLDLDGCEHLEAIADELAYDDGKPSLLIGQDNWEILMASDVRRGRSNQPVASCTPLGWVLHGQSTYGQTRKAFASLHRCSHVSTNLGSDSFLDQHMKEYFDLESLGVEPRRPRNDPETKALRILEEKTRPLPEGGYETGLLWENEGEPFPNNYQATLGRLQGVENRLRKDPHLKTGYTEQMGRMLEQGYAELAPVAPPGGMIWYLPHFPVLNPAKPGKIRLVLDAAARTHGVCLNDRLITGPSLLQSLWGVLLRFRQKPIGVAADIKDMFLRIKIRAQDRDALRFLWRDDSHAPPTEFRMTSLPFGATSSPTTAIYVKNLNATLHKEEYPEAVSAIINNHYMDDYLQSFDTVEEAARIARAVDTVHRRGNFELQKWTSNCGAAIADFSTEAMVADVPLSKAEKVLGLVWRTADDTLGFNLSKIFPYFNPVPTKRELLRVTMSLYDPVGMVAPITTQAKRILRTAWILGLGWDERLPKELESAWQNWLGLLKNLESVRIPRCHPGFSKATKLELHVFVDASETAYASAVYWRSESGSGEVNVSLAAAKGRVASLKITSIPRLELQAAVMGSRLAKSVGEEHDRRPDRRVFWSDSRTVLSWLGAGAKSFKPFVAHRIAELEDTTTVEEWRWCPSALNVSDDCTRDTPPDFAASHRWFRGPHFLYQCEEAWPTESEPPSANPTEEERVTATTTAARPRLIHALPEATRFSSWLRLIRATGRLLQFIELCRARTAGVARKRTRRRDNDDPAWKPTKPDVPLLRRSPQTQARTTTVLPPYIPLAAEYTLRAEHIWVRAAQEESFPDELDNITKGQTPSSSSRLRHLSLIIDHGILRLRSRIAATPDVTGEIIAPAIMDGNHRYCRLYIDWIHRQLHHSGVECVTNEVRQRYWVVRLRPTVRSVIKRCQPCRLRRAAPSEPQTGDLPSFRLAHHRRSFTFVGLDYFGPLSVTVARHHEKRYVALFTCLVSRAVHLEIANSLSADSAILALRRMMARRGAPECIWSDNGTNFHGADAELQKAALTSLQKEAEIRRIRWLYIPVATPFWGGTWERMVGTVKRALKATLQERHPHEDILHTLLTEVEHTVNSRPLTHVSVSAEDEEALTPNHFLLGGPSKVPLPGTFSKVDELGRSHWKASQRLADLFWHRWVREVLPMLQHRREPHGRGDPIKEGDIVLIVDPNLPRNIWPKGRVSRVYPGAGGVVRLVDVMTKNGTVMQRPTKRLVVLPVE